MDTLALLLIGGVAGWLAGVFVQGDGNGLSADMVIGVIGALVGGYMLRGMGVDVRGLLGSLTSAVVGALVLLVVVKLARIA